jgi:hypothetical protein
LHQQSRPATAGRPNNDDTTADDDDGNHHDDHPAGIV